jgi:prolyl oligopeptidase
MIITRSAVTLLLALCATTALAESAAVPKPATLAYPATRAGDVVDDYFGRKVADPYRWLEDLDSADTAAWVAAQNKVTFGYLDSLPGRAEIRKRLTELWDYRRTGVPMREAG